MKKQKKLGKKKKRAFTLIELLAVIVVLAIIALIATPIVMNVIKNAQKGAVERSAERYLDAVENAIATNMLTNQRVVDGTYAVDQNGNLSLGGKPLTVEVKGDLPDAGSKVGIKNGQVVVEGTNMSYGDYTVTIDYKGSAKATEKGATVSEVLCKAIAPTEQNIITLNDVDWNYLKIKKNVGEQATSEDPYKPGAIYSCDLGDGERTFYVLKEEGDNVKLLMNENLGGTLAWCASGNNDICEGDGVKSALANRTSGWTKLNEAGGTVELADAQDLSDIAGDTQWNWCDQAYSNLKDWMVINLNFYNVPDASDAPYGYWTSTSYCNYSGAWVVKGHGYLNYRDGDIANKYGIRPVIVIPKANMSL